MNVLHAGWKLGCGRLSRPSWSPESVERSLAGLVETNDFAKAAPVLLSNGGSCADWLLECSSPLLRLHDEIGRRLQRSSTLEGSVSWPQRG
jgi:hypothetical protein